MSKHTPGSWEAIGRAIFIRGDHGRFLTEFDFQGTGLDDYNEACDNAQIAAASPDMLEALEEGVHALAHMRNLSDVDKATLGAMRAAIAKARGDAP